MSITFIPKHNGVDYQCLSTDMSGSAPVDGISWVGANLFVTDTKEWYRVIPDMYLVPLVDPPSSGSITVTLASGDIEIGAVELKDATTDTRAKIITGSSIVSTDVAIAVHDANVTYPTTYSGSITNVVSASLVAGGSAVWVDNDISATFTGIISASLVAGGSTVSIEDQNLSCTGFVSSITNDDLDPWLTTTAASQVINFANTLNDLKIYASSSALYVQLNSGSHCIYIPANENLEITGYEINSITFSGGSPVDFRYYGQYN